MISQQEKTRIVTVMNRFVAHTHTLGVTVESVEDEELTLRLPYSEELVGDPETGILHGGVITVLLDQALGVSSLICNSLKPSLAPTLDLRIDHLGVAPQGKDIYATASVIKATRKVIFIQGVAYWESRDKPIARGTGTWIRLKNVDVSWIDNIDLEDL